jgi:hypothetical protein
MWTWRSWECANSPSTVARPMFPPRPHMCFYSTSWRMYISPQFVGSSRAKVRTRNGEISTQFHVIDDASESHTCALSSPLWTAFDSVGIDTSSQCALRESFKSAWKAGCSGCISRAGWCQTARHSLLIGPSHNLSVLAALHDLFYAPVS